MIERFRKAWANRRRNPFTDQDLAVDKNENGLVIPTSAPYFIQLVEVPRKDVPSTVSVYNVTDSVYMTEVTGSPGQNEFRVDYPEPDGEGTGLVEFSSLDAGKTVNVSYKATGSAVVTEFLDTLISHPLNEAAGDMYYHDGDDVARLPDAVNHSTKKLKSTVLSPVDTGSTDTEKDKAVSNALAKGWEDHKNVAHVELKRIIGERVKIYNSASRQTSSYTMTKLKEVRVNENTKGKLTVLWSLAPEYEGKGVASQLYVNGTPVGTEKQTSSLEGIQASEVLDRDLVDGDLIQIYGRIINGPNTCFVWNMELDYSWAISKLMGEELVSHLETTSTRQISTTNQDPA